ncbi:MAG: hypothetical protein BroJett042_00150 [Bacteroidota bacterium]|nr:MAG: hypothetical protein BroJett042_00150 [Bacteroidota bacterium]
MVTQGKTIVAVNLKHDTFSWPQNPLTLRLYFKIKTKNEDSGDTNGTRKHESGVF